MLKTKELSCGDRKASSHGERKEGKRGEEGGSRLETKPTKLSKLKWLKKANKEEVAVRLNLANVKSKPVKFLENVKT